MDTQLVGAKPYATGLNRFDRKCGHGCGCGEDFELTSDEPQGDVHHLYYECPEHGSVRGHYHDVAIKPPREPRELRDSELAWWQR